MEQPIIATKKVTSYILQAFKLRTHKKLGQNFLIDPEVVRQIAAAAELTAADTVLEIGPGIGTLTQALAETKAQVVAVELDAKLVGVLHKTLAAYSNVRIIPGDILKLDIAQTVAAPSFKVAANLPYYITTPILFAILEQDLPWETMVVMVQKEVAQRIAAAPGGKEYGVLSVAMQYYAEPQLVCQVPRTSFLPVPKVDSAVVLCRRRRQPPVTAPKALFFKVVRAAFSVRRKMLSNSLKNMGLNGEQVRAWLTRAGIDGTRRAETLSLAEFDALAQQWQQP